MSGRASPARKAALAMVTGATVDRRPLRDVPGQVLADLAPGSRAEAERLARDTLRWAGRADRVLGRYLRKLPHPAVFALLRMATVEICQGTSPVHAIVNDAVELCAGQAETRPFKGMVNAILRKVADEGPALWPTLPVPHLPKWLRAPLVAAWGKAAVADIEAAHCRGAPLDLTARDDPGAWAGRLGGELLPTGTIRLAGSPQVSALPGFDEGAWWVQDAAAALPVRLLEPKPGERILDLCAAPGGKTLQLAAAGAEVVAVEISPSRAARLQENLARTGLGAEVRLADAFTLRDEHFDAILLDAPCSATGTIRRHPDLPFVRDGEGITALVDLQARMFDHALGLLAPQGRLVYCTCSLLPAEGEEVLAAALGRHPGLHVAPATADALGIPPAWLRDGAVRTRPDFWPDQGGLDGFFIARVQFGG